MSAGDAAPRALDGPVRLELSADEALVFFEFLQRYSESDTLAIVDQAEQRLLWDLCCMLERVLVTPFSSDYTALLEAARSRVRDVVD